MNLTCEHCGHETKPNDWVYMHDSCKVCAKEFAFSEKIQQRIKDHYGHVGVGDLMLYRGDLCIVTDVKDGWIFRAKMMATGQSREFVVGHSMRSEPLAKHVQWYIKNLVPLGKSETKN